MNSPNQSKQLEAAANNSNQNSDLQVDSLSTDRQSINENYLHNILYNTSNVAGNSQSNKNSCAANQDDLAKKSNKSSYAIRRHDSESSNSVHLTNSSPNTSSKNSHEFMDASRKPTTTTVKNSQETDRAFTEPSDSNFVQPDANKYSEDSEDEFLLEEDSSSPDPDAVEDEHTVKFTVTILAAFPSGKRPSTGRSVTLEP